jgi:cytochrome b561
MDELHRICSGFHEKAQSDVSGMARVTPSFSRRAGRSQTTRILHLVLLLLVIEQLASSEFMHRPFPGDPPGWTFILHERFGLVALAVAAAFWVWTLVRRGETAPGRLMPWFSAHRIAAVFDDLIAHWRRLSKMELPDDADSPLVSAIHGLGLLAVTITAATGTAFYFLQGHPIAGTFLDMHKLLSNLVWAYLFLHAGMAALHHLLGSDILSRIFWLSRRARNRFNRSPH